MAVSISAAVLAREVIPLLGIFVAHAAGVAVKVGERRRASRAERGGRPLWWFGREAAVMLVRSHESACRCGPRRPGASRRRPVRSRRGRAAHPVHGGPQLVYVARLDEDRGRAGSDRAARHVRRCGGGHHHDTNTGSQRVTAKQLAQRNAVHAGKPRFRDDECRPIVERFAERFCAILGFDDRHHVSLEHRLVEQTSISIRIDNQRSWQGSDRQSNPGINEIVGELTQSVVPTAR